MLTGRTGRSVTTFFPTGTLYHLRIRDALLDRLKSPLTSSLVLALNPPEHITACPGSGKRPCEEMIEFRPTGTQMIEHLLHQTGYPLRLIKNLLCDKPPPEIVEQPIPLTIF